MLYKIYCLKNENNEVMYIGYTSLSEARRMAEHRHSHPHRAAYTFEIIDVFETKAEALAAEREYIRTFKPVENIAPGQGFPASLILGREVAHAKQSRRVVCLDTGVVYGSINDAAAQTGSNRNHVKDCCHRRRHQTNGLHFQFVEDYQREAKGENLAHADTEVIAETKSSATP